MRIDLPLCNFKNCRCSFDGNCTAGENGYQRCEYRLLNSEIESLQAQLAESQRREQAAVDMLRTIDWVGSGAKGRIEDAIGILSGPARLVKEDRKVTLLRAARNLLKKQQDTPYILNLLDETVFYDDTYCDGMCLLCDINIELKEVTNGD
jgi:hypothetical protein